MTDLLNNPISFHDLAYEFATSGVYAIYCKHTDTYYIGQGVVVLRRLVDHFSQLREGRHPNDFLQREFLEVGEDRFVIGLVADMPNAPQVDLLRRESEEIQRFKSHGKRLYNKVSGVIRLSPTMPAESHSVEHKEHNGEHTTLQSHAERVNQREPAAAACYDCGLVGLSQVNIFVCDDDFSRCQSCIELYLDNWRSEIAPKRKDYQQSRIKGSYRRWLVPRDASVQEHILLAANNFSELFGYAPSRLFVHPEFDAPDSYRGMEILKGGIAVGRYIDIPIDYHD